MRTLAEQYRRILPASLALRDEELSLLSDEDAAGVPPEIVLQAQWFAGEFGHEFETESGDTIEIVQLGTWNRGEGPDFLDASIRLNGELRSGPVELDPDVRDWHRHGHDQNPAFDEVILHLFMRSGGRRVFTKTVSNREVPQVRLPIGKQRDACPSGLPRAHAGRCSAPLAQLEESRLRELLHAAAQFRLQRKGERLNRLAQLHGPGEALYQALAEALGYKQNKLPFTLLAQRLPLKELRRDPDTAEALLFGMAGFLPSTDLRSYADDSRSYLRQLWERWWPHRATYERMQIPDTLWKRSGIRPANHPQRRLAALAELVRQWKTIQGLAAGCDVAGVFSKLAKLEHPFWSHHYTLTSKPAKSDQALLGDTRITEMLVNVFYPLAISRQPERWADYVKLPSALGNRTIETAAARLLSANPARLRLLREAACQQGLLQIFEDFCKRDATNCTDCPFPNQLGQFTAGNSAG